AHGEHAMCLTYSDLPLPDRLISAMGAGMWGIFGLTTGRAPSRMPQDGLLRNAACPGRELNTCIIALARRKGKRHTTSTLELSPGYAPLLSQAKVLCCTSLCHSFRP